MDDLPLQTPAMFCIVRTGANFYHCKRLDARQQQLMTEAPELFETTMRECALTVTATDIEMKRSPDVPT